MSNSPSNTSSIAISERETVHIEYTTVCGSSEIRLPPAEVASTSRIRFGGGFRLATS